MARMAREKSSTGVYHVMFRGINRQVIFRDDQDRMRFLDTLERFKTEYGYELYGYCLMNNHVHLLIKEVADPISIIMKCICSSYVYWYNARYERCGHLFQERFKSEVVETDSYFLTVLRYIHQNPLKAKIAKSLLESKWTSYKEYIGKPRIVDVDRTFEYFSNVRSKAIPLFVKFMNADNKDRCLDDEEKMKLTDREVREHLRQLGILNPTVLQQLDKNKRDGILKELKKIDGITKVQIAKVTGISRGIVTRA